MAFCNEQQNLAWIKTTTNRGKRKSSQRMVMTTLHIKKNPKKHKNILEINPKLLYFVQNLTFVSNPKLCF